MPRAIIFDFDDTLVLAREAKWRQHQAVAKQFYGIDLTEDDLKQHWGKAYDETLRAYYREADTIENMGAAKLSLEAAFPVQEAPTAKHTVKKLYSDGIPIAILSASRRELVTADLERLGFDLDHFLAVQASDDTEVHKPDPAVFAPLLKTLAKAGITQDIIYVGDSLRDYQAAQQVGLDFVGITTGLTTQAEFYDANAPSVIKKLEELLKFFW